MTSFRFTSRPGSDLAAVSTSTDTRAIGVVHQATSGSKAEFICAQTVVPFGALNVIAIPTAISATPPTIQFGSLSVAVPHSLLEQIGGGSSECSETLAVSALLHSDGWQAQSCSRVNVAPCSIGGVTTAQPGELPDAARSAVMVGEATVDGASQLLGQQTSSGANRSTTQAATQTRIGVSGNPALPATRLAYSTISFARRSPSRACPNHAVGEVEDCDLDRLQDIPI